MAQPPKSDESNADTITESTTTSPAASADAPDTPDEPTAPLEDAPQASPEGDVDAGEQSAAPADEAPEAEVVAEAADEVPAADIQASPAPIEDAVHPDAPDAASLPSSFEEMGLPEAMRTALASMGWGAPTKVQAAAFGPVTGGRDVLVQSQTGSGKTGAFCLPWLAARFEDGDARETGVQLLVMTPTRELAKQVCDQLVNLAGDTPLTPLPVYGGTAIGPQFDALKAGVHAVVGTPGRILDHIRRRTLDLSKVRTVVLDEADEMLSMGFLEDIHAILDACPRERQTTLFSATVPSDIERIARRYMNDPESLKLSGDDIAAAQIEHLYYSVPGSMRTRDLLSVVAQEEPGSTLIFCNTREETNLVANVLRREGFSAEALSSDLSQAAREHVLGAMRKGRLRFLVATDVASRGIDISHISHVFNYSFPQNAESYVHRTGRTGRAGRAGKAISLIGPHDMGNFYHLKLQYPSIEFSEGHLPSREEQEALRKENKLDMISKRFRELVSPEWTLLARTLAADPRGEQVIAYLLSEAMSKPDPATQVARDLPEEDEDGEWRRGRRGERRSSRDRDGRDREGRDRDRRGRRGDRDDRRDGDDESRGRRGRDRDDARRGGRDDQRRRSRDRDRDREEDATELDATTEADAVAAEGSEATEEQAPRRRRRRRRGRDRDEETAVDAAADADTTDEDAAPADDETSGEATVDADADADATGDGEGQGRRRRRRRRRRRGSSDEENTERTSADASDDDAREEKDAGPTEPAPAPALTASAGPEGDTELEAAADAPVEGEAPSAEGESDELESDASDEAAELTAAPCEASDGFEQTDDGASARGRRRRRRRRRRGGRGKPEGAAEASGEETTEARSEQGSDEEASADAESGEEGSGGKRRRRRRRGGRAKKAEAPVEQHVPQDQIIIDIDESELEVVRGEFGEIDELDDLTLKGRRRGVIDALQDEVELEDMSEEDTPADAETSETEGDDEASDDDAAADDEVAADGADTEDEEVDEKEAKKRKRRRRRRKKKKVEEAPPELTAPPHKDFWEVWSTNFTFREFEDDTFRGGTEAIVDEPEPEPEPKKRRSRRRSTDDDKDPAKIGTEDGPMVTVALNVGRSHGKKSAHIRELLASDFGLEGRSVRNLTVKETMTEFRVSTTAHTALEAAVLGYVFDDIELELTVVEAAPQPEPPAEAEAEAEAASADPVPSTEVLAAASEAEPEVEAQPEA